MSKSKHTPGPWCVGYSEDAQLPTINAPGAFDPGFSGSVAWTLAMVTAGRPGHDEQEANARLIAAAPDMLEALESIVRQWDTPNWKLVEHTGVCIAKGRAAIAKAKGEVVL